MDTKLWTGGVAPLRRQLLPGETDLVGARAGLVPSEDIDMKYVAQDDVKGMDGTPVFKDYVCTHHNLRSF